MLTLYLACLIFGGTLLGFSIFFGGEHSHPSSGDHDFSHGEDMSSPESSGEIEINSGNLEHPSHSSDYDGVKMLSFRNLIFFTTFFGLTGTIFGFLEIEPTITLASSLTLGVFSWFFGHKLMKYLKSSETGEAISTFNLKGHIGTVSMPVYKNKKGKIIVETQGTIQEITAMLSESEPYDKISTHDKILIIEMKNNTAICIKTDL